MGKSKFLGPGYFYEITFSRKEDRWMIMITNSTVMFFPGEIPPTTRRIFDESRRKLSEIYDSEIVIQHFDLIKARTTFLI